MNGQEGQEEVYVQMFESFCIRYKGRILVGGKIKDPEFARLLQIILHNAEQGVKEEELERLLLAGEDKETGCEGLLAIINRAERKLRRMGFEADRYFLAEAGVYRWTPEIPVREDAAEFERLYQKAQSGKDEADKLSLIKKACHIYKGEFLAEYTGIDWIEAEAKRYRELFYECAAQKEELLFRAVQKNLTEKNQNMNGGYLCSYQTFQGIYQLLVRMIERNGQEIILMMCTMIDKYGLPMKEGRKRQELSEYLGEAICKSVRRGDIVGKYGEGRYLVLLAGTIREHCILVQERIDRNFMTEASDTASIRYQILPIEKTGRSRRVY